MNLSDTQYGQHANNMMAWLEAMKINKTSPRQPLEQQLQALSLSYKNAQQKLLSLQKQVYHESLYNEKQRSIIQILKYIINGSLDDETILSYLVDMQQQSVSDLDLKYQIKTQLQQIKQMVLKHKTQDKKRQSMKGVALSDLKKQLIKCNQIKKQLMEDLDRTLNQKGALETVMQEMKNQSNQQQQIKISLQLKIQQLSIQISQLNLNNQSLKCEMNKKDQLLRQNQETLTNISRSLSKLLGSPDQKLQNPSKIIKQMKRVEDKLQKYRSLAKELNEKIKKQSQNSQVLSIIHEFLPQQAVKLWQQYEKTSQKCLLKQIEGMAKLQKKKYSQLQHCQQEVWRLKSRLLRDGGSWLKSGRTGATISGNKQNINKNRIEQDQVAEFEIEIQDQKST